MAFCLKRVRGRPFTVSFPRSKKKVSSATLCTADRLDAGADLRVLALTQANHRSRLAHVVCVCASFLSVVASHRVKFFRFN